MSVIDEAKVASSKLISKYQTERWWNGCSIDPHPEDAKKVCIFLYVKYPPPLYVTIPTTIDGFPIIVIDESKKKFEITTGD